mgnify:CR=1 FL=1
MSLVENAREQLLSSGSWAGGAMEFNGDARRFALGDLLLDIAAVRVD